MRGSRECHSLHYGGSTNPGRWTTGQVTLPGKDGGQQVRESLRFIVQALETALD
jgi:hypothetical protein